MTKRPQTDKGRENWDTYNTRPEVADSIVQNILYQYIELNPKYLLDVGAGTGIWGQSVKKFFPNAAIDGVEIQDFPKPEGYRYWYYCNFLDVNQKYEFVIGNPPFAQQGNKKDQYLSTKFMRHALDLSFHYVAFLYTVNTLAGVDRMQKVYKHHRPETIYVFSKRQSFNDYTKTQNTYDHILIVFNKFNTASTNLKWFDFRTGEII